MKRIVNNNAHQVKVGINGNDVQLGPRETVIVEDHVDIVAPSGVFVTPQRVILDSSNRTNSNVLMG